MVVGVVGVFVYASAWSGSDQWVGRSEGRGQPFSVALAVVYFVIAIASESAVSS